MAISISPLTESEIPTFIDIELEAFRSHPRMGALFPIPYREDLYAFYNHRKMQSFHNSESRFMKAVDDQTGEILSASEWTFVLEPEKAAATEYIYANEQPPPDWPSGANWAMRRWFKNEWREWKARNIGEQPHIILDILVTHPHFQGQGVGAKLLAWGCEQADKHGVMMCLESSQTGLKLYKRFGFREMRTLRTDMKLFGWSQPYDEDAAKRVYMVRDARPVVETA